MKNQNEIAKVKDWFLENDLPYFAIHTTKTDRVWWNNTLNEVDEAAAKLDKFLARNEPGQYTLYVYDTKNIKDIKEATGTLKFKFGSAYENSGYDNQEEFYKNRYPVQSMLLEQMKELTAEVKLLKERAEIEAESDDDEEVEKESQSANIVGAIVGHPAVQNLLMNFLTNITANMMTAPKITPQTHYVGPQAMAGIDDENTIINKLLSKGVTWNDLDILSNLPETQIQTLLSMLRAMDQKSAL